MKRLILLLVLMMTLLAGGCEKSSKPLHIGSKDFTEQYILAEIMAQLIQQEGIPVKRSIPYGDTFLDMEALKRGNLDLYPEYDGTGLVLLGQPPIHDGDKAYARVRELFGPLGLEWLGRFGFSNEYVLVMRSDRAAALNIKTISDLLKLPSPPRLAIDKQFLERPVDGYAALKRRYGLVTAEPLVFEEGQKDKLYQALLDDKVDVTEGFSTDGQIADFGLTVLEDDLNFFPVYEPAPLVRQDALTRYPKLKHILNQLQGTIGVDTMREMNKAVELEGQDYKLIAHEFLVDHQLMPMQEDIVTVEQLLLAVGMLDEVEGSAGKAVRAVRKAFPTRRVTLVRNPNPLQRMLEARTRLALVGAESFFELKGVFPKPINRAQALGVVGYQMAHLLTRAGDGTRALEDMTRLGVGPENGASQRTARMVLTSLGLADQIELVPGTLKAQVVKLRQSALDGLFLMVPLGHVELTELMNQGGLKLVSLQEWGQGNNLVRFPFLRLARIPAGTYEGQDNVVETLSTQLVLAGPSPQHQAVGNRGPAIIVGAKTQPISDTAILALNEALGSGEKIDPSLPSAAVLKPTKPLAPEGIETQPAISLTNLVVILVIIYLIYLFQHERHRKPEEH